MGDAKFSIVGTNMAEKAALIWNVADMLRGPFKPHEYGLVILPMTVVYSGTLVKTKIDKFLNVSGSRHCSIKQQCREVALCWRDVPDG